MVIVLLCINGSIGFMDRTLCIALFRFTLVFADVSVNRFFVLPVRRDP